MKLVEEKATSGDVGLEPFAIDDKLRNGPLAYLVEDFGGGGGIGIDIDFGVPDSVGIKELLGGAAVAAPLRRIDLNLHPDIVLPGRKYDKGRMIAEEINALQKLEMHPIESGHFRQMYSEQSLRGDMKE